MLDDEEVVWDEIVQKNSEGKDDEVMFLYEETGQRAK